MPESKKILVVEDDMNMLEVLIDTLEDEDYEVVGVTNVKDAVEKAKEEPFDLVVTDVRMAGTDGVSGLGLIKHHQPKIRSIVISGYSDQKAVEGAVRENVDDWLAKPFKLHHFIDSVQRALDRDNWVKYFGNIIAKAPLRFLDAAANLLTKEPDPGVSEAREKAFQVLYTGIKGGAIPSSSASINFSILKDYDTRFKDYLETPSSSEAKELKEAYGERFEHVTKVIRTTAQTLGRTDIPRSNWSVFWTATQDDLVSFHDFKIAPTLLEMKKSEFRSSPDLLQRRIMMWGEF